MKRDCKKGIPRNNVFQEIIQTEGPGLLEHAEVMVKAGIGLLDVDQERSGKVTTMKSPKGPSEGPQIKFDSIIPSQCQKTHIQSKI